ncbi:MAG TPA: hypothetical protein VGR00_03465 [Thermoanaerobaculia bacterium]|nr:hypothetical protein [Thermoanaerobaculia bacterium]
MKCSRLLAALVLVAASPLLSGQPVGPEFRLNAHTTGDQRLPAVAASMAFNSGGFVVAWQSDGQDGDGKGIFTRLFDSAGSSLSSFRVNDYTTGDQKLPSVGVDLFGNFVVAWASYGQLAPGGDILARRFDSSGTSLGGEFVVNTSLPGDQFNAGVAVGFIYFMVVWYDDAASQVVARRFSSTTGAPVGGSFPVDPTLLAASTNPDIFAKTNGFLVTWTDLPASDRDIFAHRFDFGANPVGSRFQVNTFTAGDQTHARVASSRDEMTFAVVWASPGEDGDGAGVFGRLYDYSGVPKTAEFQVNAYTTGDQQAPVVAFDTDSSLVVVWESVGQDGSGSGIYRRRFDTSGVPLSGVSRVNSYTTGAQSAPVVSAVGNGDYVVSWESAGQDGDGFGVYGQRHCTPLQSVTLTAYNNTPICTNGTGALAVVSDVGGGYGSHQWGYKTTPGGTFNPISGETFVTYQIQGSDFPPSPGTYYLVCRTTPECGSVTDSNVVGVTIISAANDTTTPTVNAPFPGPILTQTLCQ